MFASHYFNAMADFLINVSHSTRMHYSNASNQTIMLLLVLWKQALGLIGPHTLPLIAVLPWLISK
jgi:hypothetical protein